MKKDVKDFLADEIEAYFDDYSFMDEADVEGQINAFDAPEFELEDGSCVVCSFRIVGYSHKYWGDYDTPPYRKEDVSITCEKMVFYNREGMVTDVLTSIKNGRLLATFDQHHTSE